MKICYRCDSPACKKYPAFIGSVRAFTDGFDEDAQGGYHTQLIEVQYRGLKQTMEHRKLLSDSPRMA